jgi:hypothetical protein
MKDQLAKEIESLTDEEFAVIDFMVKVGSQLRTRTLDDVFRRERERDYKKGYAAGYLKGRREDAKGNGKGVV